MLGSQDGFRIPGVSPGVSARRAHGVLRDEQRGRAGYSGEVPAPTLVEARLVARTREGPDGERRLDALIRRFTLSIAAFDEEQADVASAAHLACGRGSGHRARLNLGDTFSYVLAYVRDEPLLYAGDGFSRTDIRSALDEYAE